MTEHALYDPSRWRHVHVQDAATLRDVAGELRRAEALGVDLEMGQRVERLPGGQQEWTHILALVQIASDSLSIIVDPLRCDDLSPLRPIMAGPARKVFLGGGQDVALLDRAGIPARTIVDVGEIGLAIFGRREDGMAALARRMFGLSLDKTVRRTDWMARPLNPTLLTYAFRDAELTLTIYRWFQAHYPEITRAHERELLDPPLPPFTAPWLQLAFSRSSSDAYALAMEHGLDPRENESALAGDLGRVLNGVSAPRMVNRLVRIATDLGLESLVPDIAPLVDSPSSLVRASAARALGRLATPDAATLPLERLKEDPVEDVRRVAATAMKESRRRATAVEEPASLEEQDQAPSLDDDTRAALQRLLEQMGGTGE